MISKNALVTHAQYAEDLTLKALLSDIKKGFYIDIGANDPDEDSVTKLFYLSGWSGINVEPIEKQCKILKQKRPRDINLCVGIGDKKGQMLFKESSNISGHSTFSRDYLSEKSDDIEYIEYNVEVITLRQLFEKHAGSNHVNFIKIDVEGLEYEVVKGNDWKKYRPDVICIEANHKEKDKDWGAILESADYKLFVFDGLNAYYVASEAWGLTDGYAERAVQLRHDALNEYQRAAWLRETRELIQQQEMNNELQEKLNACESQLAVLRRSSLVDQPLRTRVTRATKALTVDWLKYKKKSRD